MFKRLLLLITIALGFSTVAPPINVQAQSTYTDSFTIVAQNGPGGGSAWVNGWVVRDLQTGRAISAQVQMQVNCGGVATDISAVLNVPGDPDRISVSRDLGWAGLTNSTFNAPIAGSSQTLKVTLKLNLTATAGVTVGLNSYIRSARWSGKVETSLCSLNASNTSLVYAQITSERRPNPYYG